MAAGLLWSGLPGRADILVTAAPDINDAFVGQTVTGTYSLLNGSFGADEFPAQYSEIDLYPSCAASSPVAPDCANGTIEPDVYAIQTGLTAGQGSSVPPGNATCDGPWAITQIGPGRYRFTPPLGEGTLVLPPNNGRCTVTFTATALRVPTTDTNPGLEFTQTRNASGVTAVLLRPPAQGGPVVLGRRGDAGESTVRAGQAAIVTTATAGPATPGTNLGTASDTATLSPVAPTTPAGAAPMGTMTFNLYGPFPTAPGPGACTGAPVFTNAVPVNGFGPYSTSAAFPVTQAGFYNFTATFTSANANFDSVGPVGCGEAAEILQFGPAQPAIVTTATTPVTVGTPITDSATLSGGVNPTGTITFTLFGPNNPTCAGAPIFTDTATVNGNGVYTSDPFTPTLPGNYQWVAVYSGDANNLPATSPCGAPNETSVVNRPTATIVTNATPTVPVGSPITDTATVTGGTPPAPAPTGTVTFTVFGPNDATCAGPPVFTSANRPLGGGPPPTATSEAFTPALPGDYRWVATYNGDGVYDPVTSPCNAPNETTVVTRPPASIVTNATPAVTIGSPISDTATVTGGPAPAPAPTGTVTFTLFGPNNPTCTGAPVFTSANRPLTGGPPPTATSDPFTPTALGSYNWVATYNGDAVYDPVTSPCGAPNETSVVNPGAATIETQATPAAPVGAPIQDTAIVRGSPAPAPQPTGTVTFTLFNNATCTGAPVFTSANRPLGGGPPPTATSEAFTPTTPGSYNWVATYNGDAFYQPVTSPCGAPGETSLVQVAQPNLTTDAVDAVTLGQPISDTATLTGGVPTPPAAGPTGTITFTLFGPNNPTCTGAPIFTSTVPVNGNGTYNSGPFTPTATGTYNWVAVYSGDASNGPATSPCGAPNESSLVTAVPTIDITKTPNPTSRPEPGGDFTYALVVTNTSNETLTITSLTDNVYGDLSTRPTCTTAIGTVLQPGGSYSCAFTAPFTGNEGASLTDVATVVAVNPTGVNVTDNDDATVTITGLLPTIEVVKTAAPGSRPEPGGDFTYTVVVTNTSAIESVTITSLTDNVYGDLATRPGSSCGTLIGTTLAPGASSAPCTFTAPFTGNAGASLTDIVTANAVDDDGDTATDTDDATVTITDVLPVISVVKTADPLSRPEPGGNFNFTAVVTNNSTEPVTITSLTDNIYGNIATQGTCTTAVGTVLQPGQSYTCTFSGPFNGNAGASQTDIVTATAVDDDGDTATANDDATVTITNVVPAILVEKDATPASRPEPGGDFTFNVRVTNTGNEAVTITSLTDDIYGNLATRGTCTTAVGTVLQPGQSYTCAFTAPFNGNAGARQTDVVTATAVDNDGTTVTDNDDATVTITGVPPVIDVTKTANPLSRPEPGGDFTYTVVVRNTSASEAVTITSLTDNVYGNLTTRANSTCTNAIGTVLQPGQSYTCQFTAPFTGDGGRSLTDVVTATAVDDDGQTATDNDDATVTITDVLPTVRVDKTASPLSRPEPGGSFTFSVVVTNTSSEPVRITSLTDDIYGDLNGRGTCAIGATLQPGGTYSCSFTGNFTGEGGASQTDTVTVRVVDNENNPATATDIATVTITDVPPTIRVDKTANPLSRPEPGGTFTFTVVVTNTSNEPVRITSLFDDVYGNLNGRGTCAIGAVLAPGSSYTCSFNGSFVADAGQSQTDVVTATAVDNEGSQATDSDDATVTITNVPPTINVVKTANPESLPAPGGVFTFTVTVTNTSNEPVRITSLADDIYGNLNGQGSCVVGAVLRPNESYTCMFPGSFTGGGGSQTDVVTAVAVDNEGSQAIAQDSATVKIIPPAPPPPPPKEPLPRTGGDVNGPARMATMLIVLGGLMVAATWHWKGGLAFAFAGPGPGSGGSRWFRPPTPPGGGDGGGSSAFWAPLRRGRGGAVTAPPPAAAAVIRPVRLTGPTATGMGLAADRARPSGTDRSDRTAGGRAGLNLFGSPF